MARVAIITVPKANMPAGKTAFGTPRRSNILQNKVPIAKSAAANAIMRTRNFKSVKNKTIANLRYSHNHLVLYERVLAYQGYIMLAYFFKYVNR
jgi:hypothetical protein